MTFKAFCYASTFIMSTALLTACSKAPQNPSQSAARPAQNEAASAQTSDAPVLGSFGVALSNMDTSVHPGDDFFKYVNGTWLEQTEIPADKSNYGSFTILADQAELRVRKIIEGAASEGGAQGSPEQKIGDLYGAFMDEAAIEAAGFTPISADLEAIFALRNKREIAAALGDPQLGLTAPFGYYVYIDSKQPDTYITQMGQSGLGLPEPEYYLDMDEKSVDIRAKYLDYIETLLTQAGADRPAVLARAVLAFETKLAGVQWPRQKRRDRDLAYNKRSYAEFKDYAPGVDWDAMLSASGLGDIDSLILLQDDAIAGGAKIFGETNANILKHYIAFHYMNDMAPYLPKEIDQANFEFYEKTLRGTEEQRERWKRGVGLVSNYLGEAVGQVYVARHFPQDSKTQMVDLVENLRAVFRDGIENLDWMGEETKVAAQDKLAKFNPKIGYPNRWKDYSDLAVDRSDLIGTVKAAQAWEFNDNISKLGQPIDREEWGMTPQTVNAYYNSSLNEIVFPAAILDAPFFDPNADIAVNYGGIGAVIGHEMGHGFDDQGRKTDGNGELRDWWSEQDASSFKARADVLVEQYNQFKPLPDLHLNGAQTLGENIGDLTGITMAYAAYKRALGGAEAPIIDGLTGDQRFFLAYGQIWQRKFREEALRTRIKTGVHSPGEYRANGIVRNFDPWYAAFNVTPDHALYLPPEQRVSIW